MKRHIVQLSLLGIVDDLLGLVEALQGDEVIRQVYVRSDRARRGAVRRAFTFRRVFVLSQGGVDQTHIDVCVAVGEILNFLVEHLERFIELAGDAAIVIRGDVELFAFAGVFSQFVCFGEVFTGAHAFAHIDVIAAESHVTERKVRIDFDGTLIVGQRGGRSLFAVGVGAESVLLQSFERRSCSDFQWNVELFYGGQGFAELAAELRGGLAESVEHLFLGWSGDLFLGDGVAVLAAHCLELKDIFGAQASDQSSNVGFAVRTQADFAGHVRGEGGAGGTSHPLQNVGGGAVG